jgi:tRNA(adenine34) deaminase
MNRPSRPQQRRKVSGPTHCGSLDSWLFRNRDTPLFPTVRPAVVLAFMFLSPENAEDDPDSYLQYMQLALTEARQAMEAGEVPVGVVIVRGSQVIASAHNQRAALADPTAHAEMIAITQAASALGDWRLTDCTLFVTLEPCPMCAGAILQARVPKVVFGALDPKAGAVTSLYQLLEDRRLNHTASVTGGVLAEECGRLLSDFFSAQRKLGKK